MSLNLIYSAFEVFYGPVTSLCEVVYSRRFASLDQLLTKILRLVRLSEAVSSRGFASLDQLLAKILRLVSLSLVEINSIRRFTSMNRLSTKIIFRFMKSDSL